MTNQAKLITALLVLQVTTSHAVEWFCTEAASQRGGNVIKSCGIGIGTTENEARLQALENSKTEFNQLCTASADCKDRHIVLDPKRTECKPTKQGYTCHRLVEFTIQPTRFTASGKRFISDAELAALEAETPKIIPGKTTKKEVLRYFGTPNSVHKGEATLFGRRWEFRYRGALCADDEKCSIRFMGDEVEKTSYIKPQYLNLVD